MWIEIFKSGKHTDSQGKEKEFTDSELEDIARCYNDKVASSPSFIAPLVKGHPETDSPAYGWVENLACTGGKLLARLKGLSSSVMKDIREGLFRKVSMAIYPDNTLRHVGLLGASPPAVKGLAPLRFAEGAGAFSEYEGEAAVANGADARPAECSEFVNRNLGCFSETLRGKYAAFLGSLHGLREADEEGSKEGLAGEFRNLVIETGRGHLFTESAADMPVVFPGAFAESNVSPYKMKLHNEALALMQKNNSLTYEEAVHTAAGLYN